VDRALRRRRVDVLFALWVARKAGRSPLRHGVWVGALVALLNLAMLFAAGPRERPFYLVAVVLKAAAGWLAGWMPQRVDSSSSLATTSR